MDLAPLHRLQIGGKSALFPVDRGPALLRELVKLADRLIELRAVNYRDNSLKDSGRLLVSALCPEQFGDVLFDQPISGVGCLSPMVMRSRLAELTMDEIQKAALHLEPRVSPHFLCRQLVFCLLVKTVRVGHIAHLTAEMCQPSQSTPGALMPEDLDIAAFRRRIMPVLEVEIRPDQSPLMAVINRPDGAQRGIDVRELVKLECGMGLQ